MTIYLSIDVATKSLAIGLYKINSIDYDNLNDFITPIAMNVYDLDPTKTAKEMNINDKAIALKKILTEFDEHINNNKIIVLIEYQMNANYMSNSIYNMIIYHYAGRADIHTVFPSLKNSIYMHKNLKLSSFLATANTNYAANKDHCKYNFLYFIFIFGYADMIKHIKQKNLDDISDTFMQCLAFHKQYLKK